MRTLPGVRYSRLSFRSPSAFGILAAPPIMLSALAYLGLMWCGQPAISAPEVDRAHLKGTWTETGALPSRSYSGVAALLPNGDVLLAGRAGNSDRTNSQLYQVSTAKWVLTSPLNDRRIGHSVTVLPSGKVLAAGGYNSALGLLATTEVFDPSSQTWTRAAVMNGAHYDHTATLLPDGKVLVVGNCYGTNDVVWLFELGPEPGTARQILDRRPTVPAVGSEAFVSAELYDPASNTWARVASPKQPRGHHSATLLTNGLLLMVGGKDLTGLPLSSAELYDPRSDTWTQAGHLRLARAHHTATLLPGGQVLVIGGQDAGGLPFSEAELFDPTTRQWRSTHGMLFNRSYHTATLLKDGRVLVVGGSSIDGSLKFVETYDPATEAWKLVAPIRTARHLHTATLLQDGRVLVVGGSPKFVSEPLSSVELFNPS